MKIVVDMNLSPLWIAELVADGHDAVHWRDVGDAAASDVEIVDWAAAEKRCILTADLDFGIIVATGGLTEPSVVQLRKGLADPAVSGDLVRQAIRHSESRVRGGAILTIDKKQARLRPGLGQYSATDNH